MAPELARMLMRQISVPEARTAWVDGNGVDATAEIGDRTKPFRTLAACYVALDLVAPAPSAAVRYKIILGGGGFNEQLVAHAYCDYFLGDALVGTTGVAAIVVKNQSRVFGGFTFPALAGGLAAVDPSTLEAGQSAVIDGLRYSSYVNEVGNATANMIYRNMTPAEGFAPTTFLGAAVATNKYGDFYNCHLSGNQPHTATWDAPKANYYNCNMEAADEMSFGGRVIGSRGYTAGNVYFGYDINAVGCQFTGANLYVGSAALVVQGGRTLVFNACEFTGTFSQSSIVSVEAANYLRFNGCIFNNNVDLDGTSSGSFTAYAEYIACNFKGNLILDDVLSPQQVVVTIQGCRGVNLSIAGGFTVYTDSLSAWQTWQYDTGSTGTVHIYKTEEQPQYRGTGEDGEVTYSVNTTLTKDVHGTKVTVNAGVVVNTAGYRIYSQGDVINEGTISNDGNDAVGQTGGLANAGVDAEYVMTGFPGVEGGIDGANGEDGISNTNWRVPQHADHAQMMGGGGAGGDGATFTGGAAGGALSNSARTFRTKNTTPQRFILKSEVFTLFYSGANPLVPSADGGGGAGGDGVNGHIGGGSGASAGTVFISCRRLYIGDNAWFRADGGKGANATGAEAGGGGGGGGGLIIIFAGWIETYNSETVLSHLSVEGGVHGDGGASGSPGEDGTDGAVCIEEFGHLTETFV
jgi:hypothetical protein